MDVGDLGHGDLRAVPGADEDATEDFGVVAIFARIAHGDRIALAALDGL